MLRHVLARLRRPTSLPHTLYVARHAPYDDRSLDGRPAQPANALGRERREPLDVGRLDTNALAVVRALPMRVKRGEAREMRVAAAIGVAATVISARLGDNESLTPLANTQAASPGGFQSGFGGAPPQGLAEPVDDLCDRLEPGFGLPVARQVDLNGPLAYP